MTSVHKRGGRKPLINDGEISTSYGGNHFAVTCYAAPMAESYGKDAAITIRMSPRHTRSVIHHGIESQLYLAGVMRDHIDRMSNLKAAQYYYELLLSERVADEERKKGVKK